LKSEWFVRLSHCCFSRTVLSSGRILAALSPLVMEDISFDEPARGDGESGDELNDETFGGGLDSGDEEPLQGEYRERLNWRSF
jgi:hypothetical protein